MTPTTRSSTESAPSRAAARPARPPLFRRASEADISGDVAPGRENDPPAEPRLEIVFNQVTEEVFKANRTDGTGFEWGWADMHRAWMDETSHKFAYRCLPLTIVNQTGWWVMNPVGFTATWRGLPDRVDFTFDRAGDFWKTQIMNHFHYGIVTWTIPFLFRTKPRGSRLLVTGPTNSFKDNVQPLTGLIESDWTSMSFTMNWKILAPGKPVRFEQGEPILQTIPLARSPGKDLEDAQVVYRKIDDDPELAKRYHDWRASRQAFLAAQRKGDVGPRDWQKHYFRGIDIAGAEAATFHHTRLTPPKIRYEGGSAVEPVWLAKPKAAGAPGDVHQPAPTAPATGAARPKRPKRIDRSPGIADVRGRPDADGLLRAALAREPVLFRGAGRACRAWKRWSDDYIRKRLGAALVDIEASQTELTGALAPLAREAALPRALPDGAQCRRTLWYASGPRIVPLRFDRVQNLVVLLRGRERFTLIAPEKSVLLYPLAAPGRSHLSPIDPDAPDLERFPLAGFIEPLVIELAAGDALFIPSGWWHHVRSPGPSIAVSHAWSIPRRRGGGRP